MSIDIYAINLDRSEDRWAKLSQQAAELRLNLVRVPGVDGLQVSVDERVDCDEQAFRRNNGRKILPGEYGCYRSHLKALSTFLDSRQATGLIIEDDIVLTSQLVARAEATVAALPRADIIKLCNHRTVWFTSLAVSSLGDEVGRAAHGPQGSAACYLITRAGASKLAASLARMEYPWDIALERGWANGTEVYSTRKNVAELARYKTTIANRAAYRGTKYSWWKRLATYGVRIQESARRISYALRG
jgi:glycosyl transferase family 25